MSDYEIGELSRQMSNLVRIGKVSQLDPATARVKVSVSGLETDWLPWSAGRAGNTRQWSPPRIGEQVVLASPYGDLGQAVVIGSLFSDEKPAPASSADQETTVFPDGSTVDYNSATNTLTLTVAGNGNVVVNCKVAQVVAETSVTVDTPETTLTGNLTIAGNLTMGGGSSTATVNGSLHVVGPDFTHNGTNVGDDHRHSGIQPGGSNTGSPV